MDKKKLQNDILEASYQPDQWLEVLKVYFGAKKFHQTPQPIILPGNDLAESAAELGSFYTADERLIGIYEVKLTAKAWINKNRVGLRNLLRQVYKYDVDGALIVFVQDTKWRFSYVSEIRTDEGKKETEPKRYSYLFGKGESCRTAAERFDKLKGKPIYINDLYDAFSVEKLNIEFFDKYKAFYEDFVQHITGKRFEKEKGKWVEKTKGKAIPEHKTVFGSDDKMARNFVKLLLGRLVFIQFLQKKGWMGVPATNKKWENGDNEFTLNFFNSCKKQDKFHSEYLYKLFYNAFNTPNRNNDIFELTGTRVPYLNGGLFENEYKRTDQINFPTQYFNDLFEFFGQYNFTIDENDPLDHEIGIDPEMLGRIFENLLEDNKDKGAFYTPKPVVQYMCQESLIQYLQTSLKNKGKWPSDEGQAKELELGLQNFVRKKIAGNIIEFDEDLAIALRDVKICDPAIGSGAFPMGLLNEIYYCVQALHEPSEDTVQHVWQMKSWSPDVVKKNIIQHSIYGVDIEKGAVDIARLRFWLSLIVDEKEPYPLPNLDFKIMQGNSLLESFEGIDLSQIAGTKTQVTEVNVDLFGNPVNTQSTIFDTKFIDESNISELIEKYFNAQKPNEKQSLKSQIDSIIHNHIDFNLGFEENKIHLTITDLELRIQGNDPKKANSNGDRTKREANLAKLNAALKKEKEKLKNLQAKRKELHELQGKTERPYFLWHLFFKDVFDKGGFDIVIGNPPYGAKFNNEEKELYRKLYPETQFKIDSYSLFLLKSIVLLKKKGNCYFIIPNTLLDNYFEENVREKLLNNNQIIEIVDLNDSIFDAAVVHSMIFSFSKETEPDYKILIRTDNKLHGNSIEIPKSFFLAQDKLLFSINNYGHRDLLHKLTSNSILLEKILDIRQTIKTGDDKKYIHLKKGGKNYKPILRGKDVFKWTIIDPKLYVDYGDHLACPRDYRIFEQPKILIREAGDTITASYDDNNYYIMSSLYNGILIDEEFDLKYLVALINSSLFQYQLNLLTFEKTKGAFTKARIFHYYKLPIKNINKSQQKPFIQLATRILQLKEKNPDYNISKYEGKLNGMVLRLYDLTYEEAITVDSHLGFTKEEYNKLLV